MYWDIFQHWKFSKQFHTCNGGDVEIYFNLQNCYPISITMPIKTGKRRSKTGLKIAYYFSIRTFFDNISGAQFTTHLRTLFIYCHSVTFPVPCTDQLGSKWTAPMVSKQCKLLTVQFEAVHLKQKACCFCTGPTFDCMRELSASPLWTSPYPSETTALLLIWNGWHHKAAVSPPIRGGL